VYDNNKLAVVPLAVEEGVEVTVGATVTEGVSAGLSVVLPLTVASAETVAVPVDAAVLVPLALFMTDALGIPDGEAELVTEDAAEDEFISDDDVDECANVLLAVLDALDDATNTTEVLLDSVAVVVVDKVAEGVAVVDTVEVGVVW
jgi:hypothetical protein